MTCDLCHIKPVQKHVDFAGIDYDLCNGCAAPLIEVGLAEEY